MRAYCRVILEEGKNNIETEERIERSVLQIRQFSRVAELNGSLCLPKPYLKPKKVNVRSFRSVITLVTLDS